MNDPSSTNGRGLRGVAVLRDVPPERLARIESECAWRHVEGGRCLIRRGDDDLTLYLLVSGRVRLVTSSRNGRDVLFVDRATGDFFGACPALARADHACEARTLEPCVLATAAYGAFGRWLAEEPGVARRVVERLAVDVTALFDRLAELSTCPVAARLGAEVLRIANARRSGPGPVRIEPIPRHAEIAASIGTNREEVSRALSRLYRRGLVRREASALVVPDLGALAGFVRDEADEGRTRMRPARGRPVGSASKSP